MEAVSYSSAVTEGAAAQIALSREGTLAAAEVAMEAMAFSTQVAARSGSPSPEPEPEMLRLPAPLSPGERAASPMHEHFDELAEKLAEQLARVRGHRPTAVHSVVPMTC